MISITIDGETVPYESTCTHWSGWNKARTSDGIVSYRLVASLENVITSFDQYWTESMQRESEDDGTEIPVGLYSELYSIGYPPLARILDDHPDFFCRIALHSYQTELIGFLVSEQPFGHLEEAFFLQSMEEISIANGQLIIAGSAVRFRPKNSV